jgi:hypothetical protein
MPQSRSGHCEEEKNLTMSGIEPELSSPLKININSNELYIYIYIYSI